jgi:hypothetical protein
MEGCCGVYSSWDVAGNAEAELLWHLLPSLFQLLKQSVKSGPYPPPNAAPAIADLYVG